MTQPFNTSMLSLCMFDIGTTYGEARASMMACGSLKLNTATAVAWFQPCLCMYNRLHTTIQPKVTEHSGAKAAVPSIQQLVTLHTPYEAAEFDTLKSLSLREILGILQRGSCLCRGVDIDLVTP